jgi:hypothetical protein
LLVCRLRSDVCKPMRSDVREVARIARAVDVGLQADTVEDVNLIYMYLVYLRVCCLR